MVHINISIRNGSQPRADDITFEWCHEGRFETKGILFLMELVHKMVAYDRKTYTSNIKTNASAAKYQEGLNKKIRFLARLATEFKATRFSTPSLQRFFRDERLVQALLKRYGHEFRDRLNTDESEDFLQWLTDEPVRFLADGLISAIFRESAK
jgi:hypothetical protein